MVKIKLMMLLACAIIIGCVSDGELKRSDVPTGTPVDISLSGIFDSSQFYRMGIGEQIDSSEKAFDSISKLTNASYQYTIRVYNNYIFISPDSTKIFVKRDSVIERKYYTVDTSGKSQLGYIEINDIGSHSAGASPVGIKQLYQECRELTKNSSGFELGFVSFDSNWVIKKCGYEAQHIGIRGFIFSNINWVKY